MFLVGFYSKQKKKGKKRPFKQIFIANLKHILSAFLNFLNFSKSMSKRDDEQRKKRFSTLIHKVFGVEPEKMRAGPRTQTSRQSIFLYDDEMQLFGLL